MAAAGLAAGDEAAAVGACEIFAELVEAPAPVLGPALPDLVRWAMSVAGTAGLELCHTQVCHAGGDRQN